MSRERAPTPEGGQPPPLRVLVVEDDPTSRRLIRHALDEAGLAVVECADVARSVEVASAWHPEVVLLDLAGGRSAENEASRALAAWAASHGATVVGLAGLQSGRELDRFAALPNVRLLRKPVEPSRLLEIVGAGVGERRERPSGESPEEPLAARLRRVEAENRALRERCSIQLAALSALDRITDLLAAPHDLDPMLDRVLRACLHAPGLTHGAIYLARADGGPVCAASVGFDEAFAADRLGHPELFDRVLDGGIALTLAPSAGTADATFLRRAGHLLGAIVTPIPGDSGPLGVLFVGSRVRDLSGPDWDALLHAISGELGRAMTVERWVGRLRASESRYHAMLENASDAILVVASDGRVIEVSRSAEALFGAPTRDLLQTRAKELFTLERPEVDEPRLCRLLAGEGTLAETFRLVRGDARPHTVEVSSSRVDLGVEQQVFVVVRDVSERDTLQAQLVMAERLASMGELAASVGHEINNPLAAAVLNLEIVARRLGGAGAARAPTEPERRRRDEDVLAPLGEATLAIHRVSQIVRDLKSLSRSSEKEAQIVDVRAALDTAARIASNEIRHAARLVKDYRGELVVEADEGRLGQVFLNLLVNAAQAITDGDAEDNVITLSARDEGDFVVVEVSDTGVGISPAVRDRIFEPFYTTKALGTGTGLGLAICHRIVTGMGGVIEVESEARRGSLFRVRLPMGGARVAVEPAPRAEPRGARRGSVLVIDDDPAVSTAISRSLVEHDVALLDDARLALERLRAGERYDLILCDLMMPKMSGMAFYEALATFDEAEARRVVFITGGAFTPLARSFLARVSNTRLDKPFRVDELRALVGEYVLTSPLSK